MFRYVKQYETVGTYLIGKRCGVPIGFQHIYYSHREAPWQCDRIGLAFPAARDRQPHRIYWENNDYSTFIHSDWRDTEQKKFIAVAKGEYLHEGTRS